MRLYIITLTAALIAACGGGGGDTYGQDGMVEPEAAYIPLPDQLIPVPDGYQTDAAFMVQMRGNLVEAS